jgi:hypothetical protein
MILFPDETISNFGLSACCSILKKCGDTGFPLGLVQAFCRTANTVTNRQTLQKFTEIIDRLTTATAVAEAFAQSDLNFEALLRTKDASPATAEIVKSTLSIILNMLPRVPNFPHLRERAGEIQSVATFSARIQPVLLRALLDHIGSYFSLISAFAITLPLSPIPLPAELLNTVCGLTEQASLAPAILLFAANVPDAASVVSSGLWGLLESLERPAEGWFCETQEKLRDSIGPQADRRIVALSELPTLGEFVTAAREFGTSGLLQPGVLEHLYQLVESGPIPERSLLDLFVQQAAELLLCLPIHWFADPYRRRVADLLGGSIAIQLSTDGGPRLSYSYSPLDSFLGAEAIYNYKTRGIRHENLLRFAHRPRARSGRWFAFPPISVMSNAANSVHSIEYSRPRGGSVWCRVFAIVI